MLKIFTNCSTENLTIDSLATSNLKHMITMTPGSKCKYATSQQSFDFVIANIDLLVSQLSSEAIIRLLRHLVSLTFSLETQTITNPFLCQLWELLLEKLMKLEESSGKGEKCSDKTSLEICICIVGLLVNIMKRNSKLVVKIALMTYHNYVSIVITVVYLIIADFEKGLWNPKDEYPNDGWHSCMVNWYGVHARWSPWTIGIISQIIIVHCILNRQIKHIVKRCLI